MKNEPATFRSSDRGLYRSCDPQWFRSQNPLHAPGTKLEWSLSIDTSEKKTVRLTYWVWCPLIELMRARVCERVSDTTHDATEKPGRPE
jgi:hypothetical protein